MATTVDTMLSGVTGTIGRKERGASTAAAYVPLSFAPGEAYQFDWSHEVVLLSGVTVIVKAAHVRLCHSRMLFVRTYPRETQEMVFDAHEKFRGRGRVGWAFTFAAAAYNLVRLPKASSVKLTTDGVLIDASELRRVIIGIAEDWMEETFRGAHCTAMLSLTRPATSTVSDETQIEVCERALDGLAVDVSPVHEGCFQFDSKKRLAAFVVPRC